jgi:virginiamycin A acetyltransferase
MKPVMREAAKSLAHWAAVAVVSPSIVSFMVRSRVIGKDRALEGSTQAWACVPGIMGQYLRRAFLTHAIAHCARSATIEFGTIFSSASASLGARAYIGPRCHLGWARVEEDVLIAAGVHVPSGAHIHGSDDPLVPIRDQPGTRCEVRIGAGAWIGSTAVVMSDVGRGTIVAAGAVVTRALPDNVVAGGVPARILRERAPRLTRVSG